MAVSLMEKGYRVTLGYYWQKFSEAYPFNLPEEKAYVECIKIEKIEHLYSIIDDYDVVHSHNEPDILTYAAIKKPKRRTPVIHDTHDLLSTRAKMTRRPLEIEAFVQMNSDGRIFVSQYQAKVARELYQIDLEKSIVFPSYILKEMIPKERKLKLSDLDGELHIVYEGGISTGQDHRNFLSIFKEIADERMHIHIHPLNHNEVYEKLADENPYIHYNQPLSPEKLIYEMTQYDCGIMPFNVTPANFRHLQSVSSNKLFDYLAAGLPIVSKDFYSIRKFIEEENVGVIFSSVKDIAKQANSLLKIQVTASKYLMEAHIDEIVNLYEKCIS